jgi:hypothetical protein
MLFLSVASRAIFLPLLVLFFLGSAEGWVLPVSRASSSWINKGQLHIPGRSSTLIGRTFTTVPVTSGVRRSTPLSSAAAKQDHQDLEEMDKRRPPSVSSTTDSSQDIWQPPATQVSPEDMSMSVLFPCLHGARFRRLTGCSAPNSVLSFLFFFFLG